MFLRLLLFAAGLAVFAPSLFAAQSADIEKRIRDGLRDKGLTLQVFAKRDHLEFDQDGRLKKQSDIGSWTIYSQFIVRRIDLSETRLRLGGDRVVHRYDLRQKKLVPNRSDMSLDVDIDIKKGAAFDEIMATVAKVFVGQEGLLPHVPAYWRPFLQGKGETPKCTS